MRVRLEKVAQIFGWPFLVPSCFLAALIWQRAVTSDCCIFLLAWSIFFHGRHFLSSVVTRQFCFILKLLLSTTSPVESLVFLHPVPIGGPHVFEHFLFLFDACSCFCKCNFLLLFDIVKLTNFSSSFRLLRIGSFRGNFSVVLDLPPPLALGSSLTFSTDWDFPVVSIFRCRT